MNQPSVYQKDDGLLIDLFFSSNYENDDASTHTNSVLVHSLAKSGKSLGYFVSDEQVEYFYRELDWLVAHGYIIFDVSAMQAQVASSTFGETDTAQETFSITAIDISQFVDNGGSIDTTALACALHVLVIANDIFIAGLSSQHQLFARRPLGVTCQGLWRAADALQITAANDQQSLQSQAAAIGAYVLSRIYLSSIRISRHMGPYAEFSKHQSQIAASLEANRQSVSTLEIGSVSEELLNAIAGSWDEAIEGCNRYGIRSADITLLTSSPENKSAPDTRPYQHQEAVSYQKSRTYTIPSSDGTTVIFVTSEDDQGMPNQLHVVDSTDEALRALTQSITIGLENGAALREYVAAMAATDEALRTDQETTIGAGVVMGHMLRRLGLDYLDEQTLAELDISGISSQQLSLLPQEKGSNELELSDKICSDCGSQVSIVGKYFMCMQCGSAAE